MKHLITTAVLGMSCLAGWTQTFIPGKYNGTANNGEFYFDLKKNSTFEYTCTGKAQHYYGKGFYKIKGNKLILNFTDSNDTLNVSGKEIECGSGNSWSVKVRDTDMGMFLACDYMVTDSAGNILQPVKSFLHCLFVNPQQFPQGSYVNIYHDLRRTVCLPLKTGVCIDMTVFMKDNTYCVEEGKIWEYTFSNMTTEGMTIEEGDWKKNLVREANPVNN